MRSFDPLADAVAQLPPVMLAIPTVQWVWSRASLAAGEMKKYLPPGSVSTHPQGYSDIAAARNAIAEAFLRQAGPRGLDWLLWLDSDMTPRPETAARLLSVARDTSADMLSALCFRRVPPFAAELTTLGNRGFILDDLRGTVEVERAGFGCMLMHRRVLEQMARAGCAMFTGPDEDYKFCARARELGFRVWVDAEWDVGHLATVPIDRAFARAWWVLAQEPAARE